MVIIFFAVSLLASVVGSICGIGGGVIIKPVLDALNIMSVSCISFLSGCTVLTMSVVSVYKNMRAGKKMDIRIATLLAVGAAVGGITGKMMFQSLKEMVGNENFVGMVQSIVLIGVTGATFIYTIFKKKITTCHFHNAILCLVVGLLLGIMSSFLGIGGGPINLMVLGFFFSMSTKEAALASLYIIMFSQVTSLGQTVITGTIPEVQLIYLVVMVIGGILGGNLGSRINKKIDEDKVDKLFMMLMLIIIFINIYNTCKFALAL
ncbi:MAG: TSUP family transporter [Coprococcus sp.]